MASSTFTFLTAALCLLAAVEGGVVPAAVVAPFASSYNAHAVNHAVAAPVAPYVASPYVASPYVASPYVAAPAAAPYAAYTAPYAAAYTAYPYAGYPSAAYVAAYK